MSAPIDYRVSPPLDGAAVPAGVRELARHLPNARYVEYERAGHFVYLDDPERFARDAADLVNR